MKERGKPRVGYAHPTDKVRERARQASSINGGPGWGLWLNPKRLGWLQSGHRH